MTKGEAMKHIHESNANNILNSLEADHQEDDYFMNLQEDAEIGILNNRRRYVSHRVRKHPYD